MILLFRHAQVTIEPDVPSTEWQMSEHGRIQTHTLATKIEEIPTLLLTSTEPKALKTGAVLANIWKIPVQPFSNLHEQDRGDNFFVANHDKWQQMVADFLRYPNEQRLGWETAVQAAHRFYSAIQLAQAQFPNETIAFVTHGRILTAFIAQHNPTIDPVSYWQELTLPAAIQLTTPKFGLHSTILV